MGSDTRTRSVPERTLLPQEEDARLQSEDRRAFLQRSAAMAGGALAMSAQSASATVPQDAAYQNARQKHDDQKGRQIEVAACELSARNHGRR